MFIFKALAYEKTKGLSNYTKLLFGTIGLFISFLLINHCKISLSD